MITKHGQIKQIMTIIKTSHCTEHKFVRRKKKRRVCEITGKKGGKGKKTKQESPCNNVVHFKKECRNHRCYLKEFIHVVEIACINTVVSVVLQSTSDFYCIFPTHAIQ